MKTILRQLAAGAGLAWSSAAAAAQLEDTLDFIGHVYFFAFFALVVLAGFGVYFIQRRDERAAPLSRIFQQGDPIHAVGPDASVADCVRVMSEKKIGAVMVMEGEKLVGIFTERDALGRVLAANLDPGRTKVRQVMTQNPFCISPTTTVGEAMELVTRRRFRHLPVVENGKTLAVVSSGDLTHWLVKDKVGEVRELVDLANRGA